MPSTFCKLYWLSVVAILYIVGYFEGFPTFKDPSHYGDNTVEPPFNEVAGDRPNLFVKWRVRYIEILFHTFYCNFGRDIEIISFVISRTSLNRGSLNRGSTVYEYSTRNECSQNLYPPIKLLDEISFPLATAYSVQTGHGFREM